MWSPTAALTGQHSGYCCFHVSLQSHDFHTSFWQIFDKQYLFQFFMNLLVILGVRSCIHHEICKTMIWDFFFFLILNLYSTVRTTWHRGGRGVVPVLELDMFGYEKGVAGRDLLWVGLLIGSTVFV